MKEDLKPIYSTTPIEFEYKTSEIIVKSVPRQNCTTFSKKSDL